MWIVHHLIYHVLLFLDNDYDTKRLVKFLV